MRARLNSIFRFLLRRPAVERDIDSELQYHLDWQIELNISRGMPPETARREAILQVGGVEGLKDDMRDARTGRWIETLLQDVRYGARVLRRNPGFALAAVLTLALGIGANTAIFSLVYGVLLRPLPYQDGGQLVVLHQQNTKAAMPNIAFSVKELTEYRTQSHTLDSVVEHHTMVFLLNDGQTGERVTTGVVSGNFFDLLGVKPILGRTFIDADDQPNAPPVIVLSHQYWMDHRGGDPNIIGKTYEMNGKPHTVIGVLPAIPQYPNESDLYMTTVQCPTRSSAQFKANRRARMMVGFARLKPGVSVDQAQADLSIVASQIQRANPDVYTDKTGYSLQTAALRDDLTRHARATFFVLLAGAGFVLLIACANVANLMLARLLRFEREMAVRAALGASSSRLLRQLLTECLLVSLTGGLVGLAIAPLTLSMLVKFAARYTTRAAEVHVDAPVLLFTLLIAVGTGVLFGLAPAFISSKRAAESLKQSGASTAGSGRQLLRGGLVVAQVAVSFVLLIGAGLMLRSFIKMNQVNPGFRTDHLLALRMTPNFSKYQQPEQRTALTDNILRRIRAINGVTGAATVSSIPLSPSGVASGPSALDFTIQGKPLSQGALAPQVDITIAEPNYFEVIGQQLIAGEMFTERDGDRSPAVAMINQTMAKHRWPGENPIGQKILHQHARQLDDDHRNCERHPRIRARLADPGRGLHADRATGRLFLQSGGANRVRSRHRGPAGARRAARGGSADRAGSDRHPGAFPIRIDGAAARDHGADGDFRGPRAADQHRWYRRGDDARRHPAHARARNSNGAGRGSRRHHRDGGAAGTGACGGRRRGGRGGRAGAHPAALDVALRDQSH